MDLESDTYSLGFFNYVKEKYPELVFQFMTLQAETDAAAAASTSNVIQNAGEFVTTDNGHPEVTPESSTTSSYRKSRHLSNSERPGNALKKIKMYKQIDNSPQNGIPTTSGLTAASVPTGETLTATQIPPLNLETSVSQPSTSKVNPSFKNKLKKKSSKKSKLRGTLVPTNSSFDQEFSATIASDWDAQNEHILNIMKHKEALKAATSSSATNNIKNPTPNTEPTPTDDSTSKTSILKTEQDTNTNLDATVAEINADSQINDNKSAITLTSPSVEHIPNDRRTENLVSSETITKEILNIPSPESRSTVTLGSTNPINPEPRKSDMIASAHAQTNSTKRNKKSLKSNSSLLALNNRNSTQFENPIASGSGSSTVYREPMNTFFKNWQDFNFFVGTGALQASQDNSPTNGKTIPNTTHVPTFAMGHTNGSLFENPIPSTSMSTVGSTSADSSFYNERSQNLNQSLGSVSQYPTSRSKKRKKKKENRRPASQTTSHASDVGVPVQPTFRPQCESNSSSLSKFTEGIALIHDSLQELCNEFKTISQKVRDSNNNPALRLKLICDHAELLFALKGHLVNDQRAEENLRKLLTPFM